MRRPKLLKMLPKKGPLAWLGIPLALVIGAAAWAEHTGWLYVYVPELAPPALMLPEDGDISASVPLVRVSDGDTVVVRYHDLLLPLRLLNIDTAESVHRDADRNTDFGKQTSVWAKEYLDGVRVRVQFKRKRWHIETDQYGRALAWVWIERGADGPADDECYNETVIRRGLSRYVTEYGSGEALHQRFMEAEAAAQREKLGVWAK